MRLEEDLSPPPTYNLLSSKSWKPDVSKFGHESGDRSNANEYQPKTDCKQTTHVAMECQTFRRVCGTECPDWVIRARRDTAHAQ